MKEGIKTNIEPDKEDFPATKGVMDTPDADSSRRIGSAGLGIRSLIATIGMLAGSEAVVPNEAHAADAPTTAQANNVEDCHCTDELKELLKEHLKPKPKYKGPSLYTRLTQFFAANSITQDQVEKATKAALDAYKEQNQTMKIDPNELQDLRKALQDNGFSLQRIELALGQVSQQITDLSESLKRPPVNVNGIFAVGAGVNTGNQLGYAHENRVEGELGLRAYYKSLLVGAAVSGGMGGQNGVGKFPVAGLRAFLGYSPSTAVDISGFGGIDFKLPGNEHAATFAVGGVRADVFAKLSEAVDLMFSAEVGVRGATGGANGFSGGTVHRSAAAPISLKAAIGLRFGGNKARSGLQKRGQ